MSEYRRGLAYNAGKKAALNGKPETANNRERGTIFFDDWADGWGEGNRAASQESGESEEFAAPPEGFEAILDDDGNDTGYRREIATGTIVTFDEGDEP